MSEGAAETISVRCTCGKKLKAPASAVGRKARCPKCGNVVTLEAPPPADEATDALYDLDSQAQSATYETTGEAPSALACPNCYQPMTPGAVLCTACGYDTRTGQTLGIDVSADAPAEAQSPPPLPPRAAATGTRYTPALKTQVEMATTAPTGSIIKGCIISAVLAFVGSLIWFGIAKGTHREIGWIAWGIGVAAGFGMMAGYNGHSVHSGMLAAAIAVGGILVGKLMVFSWVVMPLLTGAGGISDREMLQLYIADEQLVAQGLDPSTTTDAQDRAAERKADAIIDKMDAKTRATKTAEAKAAFKEMVSEFESSGVSKFSLFGSTMFSPIDIVFVVLAVASAFKIATFGGHAES